MPRPKSKQTEYLNEYNDILGMQVYYTRDTRQLISSVSSVSPSLSPSLLNDKPELKYDMIKYVEKIIEQYLWKHAICSEMIDYVATLNEVNWDLTNKGLYEKLRKKYLSLNNQNICDDNRGANRVKSIEKYVFTKTDKLNPKCYLDIGCHDGSITSSISHYFKLNKLQTHGVDIMPYGDYANITFTQYDGCVLPFSDDSFDMITCLMVLHHIPESNIDKLIHEIKRVAKPNGIIILREHDVKNDFECKMLDVMHNFYDYVWNDTTTPQWGTNYKSNTQWTDKFISSGFRICTEATLFDNFKLNPFMSYYCSFIKPDINDNKVMFDFTSETRLLNNDIPRETYKRRTKEVKNVIHWGQRKLLLTEIEFLTIHEKNITDKSKLIYVIYAGSAPGTHILYLSKLFPNIYFELYDPREFNTKLDNYKMIKTHVQYFTDDTAKEWITENHPDKIILLISDIRTGEPEKQNEDVVEERVSIDHEWQMNWYNTMKPEMAMFKFRLPWKDGFTEYLDGDIYIQPYPPATSTETRLIVGKNAGLKKYDNRKYEEQLFYFNNHMRVNNFKNILSHMKNNEKNGLNNKYDSSAEIYILQQYLLMKHSKQIELKIINMSKEINNELSKNRNLYSDQPVKSIKKKCMINLQKLGYIPDNAELTFNTFNIYVIPRYDYFIKQGLIE